MEIKPKSDKKLWYKRLKKCSLCGATLVYNSNRCENCGNINVVEPKDEHSKDEDAPAVKRDFTSFREMRLVLLIPCLYILFCAACLWRLDALMGLKTITILSYFVAGLIQGFILIRDAISLGIGDKEDRYGNRWFSPWIWVVGATVAFPIMTPIYIYAKSSYKDFDYRIVSYILSIIIIFVVGYSFSYAFKDPLDEMGTLERARMEQEEQRLSNPALFYSEP